MCRYASSVSEILWEILEVKQFPTCLTEHVFILGSKFCRVQLKRICLENCPCPHLTAFIETCKMVSFHCEGLRACLWRDLRSCIRALFEFLFLKKQFAVNGALETCWSHVFTSPHDYTHFSICMSSIHWVRTGSESYSLKEYHAQQACSFLQACWLQESALTSLHALRNG